MPTRQPERTTRNSKESIVSLHGAENNNQLIGDGSGDKFHRNDGGIWYVIVSTDELGPHFDGLQARVPPIDEKISVGEFEDAGASFFVDEKEFEKDQFESIAIQDDVEDEIEDPVEKIRDLDIDGVNEQFGDLIHEASQLTKFQTQLLLTLLTGPKSGQEINEILTRNCYDTIISGRLYGNLDTLVEEKLVEKREFLRDGRTHEFAISDYGIQVLKADIDWINQRLEADNELFDTDADNGGDGE